MSVFSLRNARSVRSRVSTTTLFQTIIVIIITLYYLSSRISNDVQKSNEENQKQAVNEDANRHQQEDERIKQDEIEYDENEQLKRVKFPTKVVLQGFRTSFARSLGAHLQSPGYEKSFFLFDAANKEDLKRFYDKGENGPWVIELMDKLSQCSFSDETITMLLERPEKSIRDSVSRMVKYYKKKGGPDMRSQFARRLRMVCQYSDITIIDASGLFAIVEDDQMEMLNHTHHVFILPNLNTQIAVIQDRLGRQERMSVAEVCRHLVDDIYTNIRRSKTTFALAVSDFLESKQQAFHFLRHSIWSEISPCPEAGWNLVVKFSWWQRVEWTINQEVVRCEGHLVIWKISDIGEKS
ncbi:uncharacterized protein LOC142358270 [Convolutriloba macropyga]|uniref:uncharacterized protein LOC142358270 n=1 Tax=Convolutriloba macropyga TaxID=536237 RepID=UPI003F51BFB1